MLTKAHRTEIALYISKTKHEWWELEDFFEDLQLFCSTKSAPECYPVILILDEVRVNNQIFSVLIFRFKDSISTSTKFILNYTAS